MEEENIANYIQRGFEDIYSTSQTFSSQLISPSSQWQAVLPNEVRDSLGCEVSVEEIKATLWSMKVFKALSPDGLHARFFQRFWLIVGDSVVKEIQKIFKEKIVPEVLNRTHIALIPKVQGPELLNNYRPISLCNSVYKIITKVIVARLTPHLDQVVNLLQTTFVPNRRGTNNAIIVQELIHTISKAKGKEWYMAIKIDLEKAYEKLEWSFIRAMLMRINLPQDKIQLIMSCVTSVSISILFNRGTLESFHPCRCIRQGDPLSPYLFINCMDFLSQLIEEKCSEKLWTPVKSSKSGPAFSYLMFVDDVVLFAKAN